MANMRAIRTRIKSIESTRQITKSMKMVSAAKRRRTQLAAENLRQFADKGRSILAHLSGCIGTSDTPFLNAREVKKRCYVIFVGNRGLCGTYNSALLHYAQSKIAADGGESFAVVCGRWGRDSISAAGFNVRRWFDDVSDTPTAADAKELTAYLKALYLDGEADEIVLIYQQFKSVLSQIPSRKTLLPITPDITAQPHGEYIFEPDEESVLSALIELYISNAVYSTLLEAKAGEHSARMTAMTAASDNTDELISSLTLELNHARQAAITTEIAEIVGGSAMK